MKLLMLQGLPASGKSTKAQEIVDQGNWVRLNRDLIREMLHFDKFTPKNEGNTVSAEKALARHFLGKDINVVIDDCNLNPKNREMWATIATECNAHFETEMVDEDWRVCVTRDQARGWKVGKAVIKNMALQYDIIEFAVDNVIICDIDGTVADLTHRLHHVKDKDPKDWKTFFQEMGFDSLIKETQNLLIDFYSRGKTIIFVTGRPEDYREMTENWIDQNGLGFAFTVIMRRKGDKRPDDEVKEQILNTYFPDRSVIHKVIDDRPSVIRMWERNGLDIINVGKGVEF